MDILLAWLEACEVTEEGRLYLTEIWSLARGAGGIREFFEKYATAEEKATLLRMWGLLVVPGPLQTREYAHAMFLEGGLDKDEAAEQTELRVRWHAKVDGPNSAHVTALIYAPVLDFRVGTPEIMIAQLEHLLVLSQRRNVVLQVVPDTGYFAGIQAAFQIASGPAIADTVDMVTLEDHVTAAVNDGWRTSSYSNGGADTCVEVSGAATGVLVRDTTNREVAVLAIPAPAWRALLAGIRA